MIRILSSEWLKTKRTAVRWITFFMPVVTALCIVAYISGRAGVTADFIYEGFFTVWTAVIIPLGAGLLAGFIIHEEELAGDFHGFLNSEVSRDSVYLGKFFLLIFCLMSCTFISTVILCAGMNLAAPGNGYYAVFMMAALFAVIGSLPILAIHLWISLLWGIGASIGTGMGGLLMGALIGATSLGDKIWILVPWAWPVKLSMFPAVYLLSRTDLVFEDTVRQMMTGLAAVVIGTAVFLTSGMIWFRKWEGRA